ncbi:MAG: HEAT repeat domain-containing protein, partial [Rhodomicrobium sp.]|nr:HEAT repeat domain-containing protein [Rhodomicrobium sp.]
MSDPFEAYSDLEDIAERLRVSDAGERRVAVMELGDSGDPEAIPLLGEMLSDPDAGVRTQAALALGEF